MVALELAPQFAKDVGIATHHVAHVFKGAELVGTICAHPLRGRGYDFDVPLLLGDFVTTEAGTGLVHIAPNAGEDDFVPRPRTRPRGRRYRRRRRHLQCLGAAVRRASMSTRRTIRSPRRSIEAGGLLGARQAGALLSAFLAVQGAADLPRHAELVHPPRRPGAHPREGAGRDREDAFRARAGPQPAGLDGRQPSRLVHQPPARLGRADRGVRRQAHRRAAARSRGGGAHRRGVQGRGRRQLVLVAAVALPRQRPQPGRLRTGDGHRRCLARGRLDPCVRAGGARHALAGRSLSRRLRPASRLVPVVVAGSGRHARHGAIQGGADRRLRDGRAGTQDVEVPGQRHRAAGGRRTSTASISCGFG